MSFGERIPQQSEFGNAQFTEPLIGVHVLAQVEFCQRAGIINSEQAAEDTGEESESLQRLDYLPDYEETIIRERLTSIMLRFWFATIIVVAAVIAVCLLSIRSAELGILCSLPLAAALFWWIGIVRAIVILRHRLDAALAAVPNEPVLSNLSEEVFNWWDLRKAGYEVDRMPEPMIDRSHRLAGRPWRVLRKGGLRIPVFRKHRGDRSVHSQHRVRIAAYCHLIEACEGSSAPFGLVMFAGSYDVVVVPNNAANNSAFASPRIQGGDTPAHLSFQLPIPYVLHPLPPPGPGASSWPRKATPSSVWVVPKTSWTASACSASCRRQATR